MPVALENFNLNMLWSSTSYQFLCNKYSCSKLLIRDDTQQDKIKMIDDKLVINHNESTSVKNEYGHLDIQSINSLMEIDKFIK